MRGLARRLSVALVVGVAFAAFVTAVLPRERGDSAEQGSLPAASSVALREPPEEKRFRVAGYSFAYPEAWARGRAHVTEAGGLTTAFAWEAPSAISSSTNGEALVLAVEPLRRPLVHTNFEPYLRLIRERLRNEGDGLVERPTPTTVAGLPALRSAVEFPDGAVRRYTVILDGRRAYFLTCTFISKEMKRGCDRVEESFRVE